MAIGSIVPNSHQGFHGILVVKDRFLPSPGSQAWVNPEKFRIYCFQYWNS